MLLISSLAALLVLSQAVVGQVPQRAVLYEGRNQGGQYLIVPNVYVPDLRVNNFDDRVQSVCVTGIWIFYVNANYNTGTLSGVEYVFGANNYCTNLVTVGGYVSSVRFAGSPNDHRADSFTLYEEDYFQGLEEYSFTDLPNLSLAGRHKSIIITGRSAWTIFDQSGYGGNSICLFPENTPDVEPYFIPNVAAIQIPNGSIRSIRKGCIGKNTQNVADFARFGKE